MHNKNVEESLKKAFHSGAGIIAKDRIKTVIILILIINAVWLGLKSGLLNIISFDKSQSIITTGQNTQVALDGKNLKPAGPYIVSITNASGLHCGYVYDEDEVKSSYDSFSAYLGEAMGTAGDPVKIAKEEWTASLKKEGVYVDFVYDRELSYFAKALGVNMESSSQNDSTRRICLYVEDDSVFLSYLNSNTNTYNKCSCAVSTTSFLTKISEYTPNGASFLFETDNDYNLVDEFFMVTEGQPKVPSVILQKPILDNDFIVGIMDILGMNSYLASSYSENGGTVYVDGNCTLRVEADGNISFHNASELEVNDKPLLEPSMVVSKCDQIANSTIGVECGQASVVLTNIEFDESENRYVLDYNYQIGGYIVSMGQKYALQISMVDGVVINSEFNFRIYEYTGEEDMPLLGNQAAALVQAAGGGMPLLGYSDNGVGINAEWIIIR